MSSRLTIAVVHTRRSPCRCHRAVLAASRVLGLRAILIDADRLPGDLDRIRGADLAFDVTDVWRGSVRDRRLVRAMLERTGIPVAGSPARVLALCDDKPAAKRRLRRLGIPTPSWRVLGSSFNLHPSGFHFPLVLKPAFGHSSRGVTLVRDVKGLRIALRKILSLGDGPAVTEPFIPGRELSVSLLEGPRGARILPIRETLLGPATGGLYTRKAKRGPDSALATHGSRVVAAQLSPGLRRRLERMTYRIWRGFGLRGWARIDLRLDAAGRPWVLEVNATPGLEPGSEFPEAARAAGLSLTRLVKRLSDSGCRISTPRHQGTPRITKEAIV